MWITAGYMAGIDLNQPEEAVKYLEERVENGFCQICRGEICLSPLEAERSQGERIKKRSFYIKYNVNGGVQERESSQADVFCVAFGKGRKSIMRTAGIIPARYGASRLPGNPFRISREGR